VVAVAIEGQNPSNNDKLIAIVEDDASMAEMFRGMLERAGSWRLHVFSDGQDAKDRLPELRAHLILLDVGLPNLDGASLYKILRGHSNTKNTPIIVITGSHEWELHRMGLQDGLLLRKPFHMEELLRMIRALLPEE
jgi:DNA-binding response OmpR family regulator